MGYARGIQWNYELIKQEIIKVKEELEINSMPSYGQMKSVRHSDDLNNAVRRSGGVTKWAKELGLKVIKNETDIGKRGEKIIEKLLKEKGYKVENVSAKKFPYDLLINNEIKIDVKISHLYKGLTGNFYTCNTEKKNPTCDIYIVICETDTKQIDKILIIPSKFAHVTQISIGETASKWNKFIDRWNYIKQYDNFYKSLKEEVD